MKAIVVTKSCTRIVEFLSICLLIALGIWGNGVFAGEPDRNVEILNEIDTLSSEHRFALAEKKLDVVKRQIAGTEVLEVRALELEVHILMQLKKFAQAKIANAQLERIVSTEKFAKQYPQAVNKMRQKVLLNSATIALEGFDSQQLLATNSVHLTDQKMSHWKTASELLRRAGEIPDGLQRESAIWDIRISVWQATIRKHTDHPTNPDSFRKIQLLIVQKLAADPKGSLNPADRQQLVQWHYLVAKELSDPGAAKQLLYAELSESKSDTFWLAKCASWLANLEQLTNSSEAAAKNLQQARNLLAASDKSNYAEYLLATTEYLRYEPERARRMEYLQEINNALSLQSPDAGAKTIQNRVKLLAAIKELRKVALDQQDIEPALQLTRTIVRIESSLSNERGLSTLPERVLLAALTGQAGNAVDAIEQLSKVCSEYESRALPVDQDYIYALVKLSSAYLGIGRFDLCEATSKKVVSVIQTHGTTSMSLVLEVQLSEITMLIMNGKHVTAAEKLAIFLKACQRMQSENLQNAEFLAFLVHAHLQDANLKRAQSNLEQSNASAQSALSLIADRPDQLTIQSQCRMILISNSISLASQSDQREVALGWLKKYHAEHSAIEKNSQIAATLSDRQKAVLSFYDGQAAYISWKHGDADQSQRTITSWTKSSEKAILARQFPLALRAQQQLARFHLEIANKKPKSEQAEDLRVAREASESALSLLEKVQLYHSLKYLVCETAAQIQRSQNDTLQATATLRRGLAFIEEPRANLQLSDFERSEYFARYAHGYDTLVSWLVRHAQKEEDKGKRQNILLDALFVSDAKRSRTLQDQLESLQQSSVSENKSQSPLVSQRDSIRKELQIQFQLMQNQESQHIVEHATDRYMQLTKQFHDIDQEVQRLRSSAVRSIETSEDELNASKKRCIDLVLAKNAAACIYHIGSQRSFVWVIQPPSHRDLSLVENRSAQSLEINVFPLNIGESDAPLLGLEKGPLNSERLCALVNATLEDWTSNEKRSSAMSKALIARQASLARVLLPLPLRSVILARKSSKLLIVPDGALQRLPFEAMLLDAEKHQYLLDVAEFPAINYIPSLSIWERLANRDDQSTQFTMASFSDPVYATTTFKPVGKDRDSEWDDFVRFQLPRLQGTRRETASIEKYLQSDISGWKLISHQDVGCTESNFYKSAQSAQVLHIAAHGLSNSARNSLHGAIALTPTPNDPRAGCDGLLHLYEIAELDLKKCELAILSACQTNVGPERPTEVSDTMSRAFMQAGARRVMASLWNLEDSATAELIDHFSSELSQQLKTGKVDYANALHQAKKSVKKKFPEPRDWAPLILTGP